jgi:hypothetical protein
MKEFEIVARLYYLLNTLSEKQQFDLFNTDIRAMKNHAR